MNDFGVRFYPIPRICPIPRNVVSLIGGCTGGCPTFVLYLNGRELVVQAPANPVGFGTIDDFDKDHPFWDWLVAERDAKVYAHYLEIIQTLLSQVEFGKTNWAYLTYSNRKGPGGGYQLTQRHRPIPRPKCPPWGKFIYESEIEYTVFGLAGDRRGIWDGKEVDVMVGWDESHMDDVDRAMMGYRLLEGMDLTYEFYGHLIGPDGEIKGIVSEAAWGRMITPDDFTRVYRAVARIQRRGLLYRGCLTNRFMIANGKVRVLELPVVDAKNFANRPELERLAELWHWNELSQLFHEIKNIGPYGNYRIPFHRFTTSYEDLECLPFPPSPERPLGGIMLYPDFFNHFQVDPWPEYADIWDLGKGKKGVVPYQKSKISPSDSILYIGTGEIPSSRSSPDDEDRPLPVSRLHRSQRRLISLPYNSRSRRRIYSSDDSSSSGHSDDIGLYIDSS
ncbi:hypothetical protein CPB83DRAFT_883110 [Crepidotus variabilis]|uniref:Uncharacterized protein n=1 Tax=Crepidotus variabilis TaxID=179855 RepID=A0A9P6EHW4_9AGAR|nr:hypothetical protein CPB83DRAFT_883110 [Crepidotus variabilis]